MIYLLPIFIYVFFGIQYIDIISSIIVYILIYKLIKENRTLKEVLINSNHFNILKILNNEKYKNTKIGNFVQKNILKLLSLTASIIFYISFSHIFVQSQPIFLKPFNSKGINTQWYSYESRFTKLQDRPNELKILDTFLKDKTSFSWINIIGDSGVGKLSLVNELINKNQNKYLHCAISEKFNMGLFVKNAEINWDIWQPKCNTLIVFDESRFDDMSYIDKSISELSIRSYDFKKKVRVVVISNSSIDETSYDSKLTKYKSTIELNNIETTDEFKNFIDNYKKVSKSNIYISKEKLERVYQLTNGNPSLLALFLNSYSKEKSIKLSDKKSLLDSLTYNFKKQLEINNIPSKCVKYLVFSSILNGLDWKNIDDNECYLKNDINKLLNNKTIDTVPSVMPIVLSDYMVMDYFSTLSPKELNSTLNILMGIDLENTGKTFFRIFKNYSFHDFHIKLFKEIKHHYPQIYLNISKKIMYDDFYSKEYKTKLFNEVFNNDLFNNKTLVIESLNFLESTLYYFDKYNDLELIHSIFDKIDEIKAKYQNDIKIQKILAKVYGKLSYAFAMYFKENYLKDSIHRLENIYSKFRTDKSIQGSLCRGYSNSIYFHFLKRITLQTYLNSVILMDMENFKLQKIKDTKDFKDFKTMGMNYLNLLLIKQKFETLKMIHNESKIRFVNQNKISCKENYEKIEKSIYTIYKVENKFTFTNIAEVEKYIEKYSVLLPNEILEYINKDFKSLSSDLEKNTLKFYQELGLIKSLDKLYLSNIGIHLLLDNKTKKIYDFLPIKIKEEISQLLYGFQAYYNIDNLELIKITKDLINYNFKTLIVEKHYKNYEVLFNIIKNINLKEPITNDFLSILEISTRYMKSSKKDFENIDKNFDKSMEKLQLLTQWKNFKDSVYTPWISSQSKKIEDRITQKGK